MISKEDGNLNQTIKKRKYYRNWINKPQKNKNNKKS